MYTEMIKGLKASTRGSVEPVGLQGCLCSSFPIATAAGKLNGDAYGSSDGS